MAWPLRLSESTPVPLCKFVRPDKTPYTEMLSVNRATDDSVILQFVPNK